MLKKLTEAFGVSGMEDEVRNIIKNEIESYCDDIKVDSMGNMTAFKKGKNSSKKILLSAHMDEVGFIISDITEDGYLKFKTVGGIDTGILISKKVSVNGLKGVISLKAMHLTTKDEREKKVKLDELYIDIGAKDRKSAEEHITIGDVCTFDSEYIEFGDNMIKAKALDDRAGCAILINMLKMEWNVDLYCSFTVQEEVGLRGAKTALYNLNPDYALVVESTTCSDMTGTLEHLKVTRIGKGAALSVLDSASLANPELVGILKDTAEKNYIPYQYKASTKGGNDAGAIYLSNGGVKTASISVPCRYIHSPVCVMSKNDYNSCRNIVEKFLKRMGEE